tara:strand:- start:284 stop:892 length:609 start_codon:yes stop_codon:yes gene_type:complete
MKIVLAHRGVTYNYKENTLKSIFEIFKYNSKKYNIGVEIDINISKDNKIFIYHDEELNDIKLYKLDYDEILKLDPDIPLLEDVLVKFNNTDYFLNIELKSYGKNLYLCNYLNELIKKYSNIKYIFSSLDEKIVNIFKLTEINCYKISNPDDNPGDIIHYSQVYRNAIGVYTIYDANFKYTNIDNFLKYKIIITDDIDKILSL